MEGVMALLVLPSARYPLQEQPKKFAWTTAIATHGHTWAVFSSFSREIPREIFDSFVYMQPASKQITLKTIHPFCFSLPCESSFGLRKKFNQSFGVDSKVSLGDLIKLFPFLMKRIGNEAGAMLMGAYVWERDRDRQKGRNCPVSQDSLQTARGAGPRRKRRAQPRDRAALCREPEQVPAQPEGWLLVSLTCPFISEENSISSLSFRFPIFK